MSKVSIKATASWAELRGILKGKTNGARLTVEEIDAAIASASAESDRFLGQLPGKADTVASIEEMNEAAATGWAEAGMAGITRENLQPEIDFGPPVGREVWPPFDDDNPESAEDPAAH